MVGKTIAQFEILSQIGMGGMGIVYKAKDTNLGRIVALKFLPQNTLVTDDDKSRFRREARAAASLNHPNICTIHDLGETEDGNTYIAMEFVDGPTLRQEIEKGPMKLDRAIEITVQIAKGLQAAHGVDIVHRDVKSANVMINADGQVKIMDFGLAKTAQSTQLTKTGSTLGTFSFMSPEQARGDEVDSRTDIWSLGVVLYELVTGRLPFGGEYEQAMVYSILNQDPEPLTAMRTGVPVALDWIMAKLLSKDPARRYQSANEAAIDLESIDLKATGLSSVSMISNLSGISTAPPSVALPGPPNAETGSESITASATISSATALRKWQIPIITGLILVAALLGWYLKPAPSPPPPPVIRFSSLLPEGRVISNTGRHSIAVSPDGSYYAYVANSEVYLGRFDSREPAVLINGSKDSREVFFSHDSRWLGFAHSDSEHNDQLMKVAVSGGSPIPLSEGTEGTAEIFGASWSDDGWIYFGLGNRGIFRVSENSGPSQPVVVPDSSDAGGRYNQPQLLPGGERLLYSRGTDSFQWDDAQIEVLDLKSENITVLPFHGNDARFLTAGYIMYGFDKNVYVAAFDPESLQAGDPIPLIEGVTQGSGTNAGSLQISLSDGGLMAWIPGGRQADGWKMVWEDASGKTETIFADMGYFYGPRLSPDGSRIAVTKIEQDEDRIWIYDIARGAPTPLTPDMLSRSPVWNPDGSRIAFSGRSSASDLWQVWVMNTDFGSEPELLIESDESINPTSWSQDGRFMSYEQNRQGSNIVTYDLETREQGQFLATSASEFDAVFSPDGKWLAYVSDKSGRFEVYIRPFPGPGGEFVVSVDGGVSPVWSADVNGIYYKSLDQVIYSVEVTIDPTAGSRPVLGTPVKITNGDTFAPAGFSAATAPWGRFDVDQENSRFIMMQAEDFEGVGQARQGEIRFVVNWLEYLKKNVRPLE